MLHGCLVAKTPDDSVIVVSMRKVSKRNIEFVDGCESCVNQSNCSLSVRMDRSTHPLPPGLLMNNGLDRMPTNLNSSLNACESISHISSGRGVTIIPSCVRCAGDALRRAEASKSLSRHDPASASPTNGELRSTILISSSTCVPVTCLWTALILRRCPVQREHLVN